MYPFDHREAEYTYIYSVDKDYGCYDITLVWLDQYLQFCFCSEDAPFTVEVMSLPFKSFSPRGSV